MDPFSFAASIVGVVETAGSVIVAIAKYVSQVKEAEGSRRRLLQELSAINGTLTSIKYLVDDLKADSSTESLDRIGALTSIGGDEGPLAHCLATLNEILDWLKPHGKMKLGQRLMWPLKQEKKVSGFLQKLERHKGEFVLALSAESLNAIRAVQATTLNIVGEQERVRFEKSLEDQGKEQQDVVEWLDPIGYHSKHQDISRVRRADTCTWLFAHETFKHWRTEDTGRLWLYGIPGSGKTVIASAVIEEMLRDLPEGVALVYFYCDFRDMKSTHPPSVLRTLLAQFIRAGWLDEVSKLAAKKLQGAGPPTNFEELDDLLKKAASSFRSSIIIVDALDECQDVEALLSLLLRLPDNGPVRLFMTSRKEQHIHHLLGGVPWISLKEEARSLESDMENHVSAQLKIHSKLARLPTEIKSQIKEVLISKAEGMFRWVQCQLDLLTSCRTRKGVQDALGNLPKNLFETYERILSAIDIQGPDVWRIAQVSLLWLVAALRPLKLAEINEAIMIEQGSTSLNEDLGVFTETDIVDICGSLIDYDETKGTITLSHFTVQEYLTSGQLNSTILSKYSIQIAEAHRQLTLQLLTYTLLDDFDAGHCEDLQSYRLRCQTRPLFEYAALTWARHLQFVHTEDEEIYKLFKALTEDPFNRKKRMSFRQAEHMANGGSQPVDAFKDMSPMFYPVNYRHLWVIKRMVQEDPALLSADIIDWGPPLNLPALKNYLDVVEVLLDLGADVNQVTTKIMWSSGGEANPLSAALGIGHEDMVTLLLKRDADINVRFAPGNETLLHAACGRGVPQPIRQLLKLQADIDAKGSDGMVPLHNAVWGGSFEAVRLLVEAGCDVRARSHSGKTALTIALDLRITEMVQYLLNHGAGFSELQDLPRSQYQWASQEPWYPAIIKELDSRAYNVTVQEGYGALDVLRVERILLYRLVLPPIVAKEVMDYAHHWIKRTMIVRYPQPFTVNARSPQIPSVVVRVPGRDVSSVRRVAFTTLSHDQGFSDSARDHGTYRWTYTWFEAGASRQGKEIVPRRKIQDNVHASFVGRVHRNVWESKHQDARQWFNQLSAGDDLLVFARAEYPGWTNYVYAIRVDLYVAL